MAAHSTGLLRRFKNGLLSFAQVELDATASGKEGIEIDVSKAAFAMAPATGMDDLPLPEELVEPIRIGIERTVAAIRNRREVGGLRVKVGEVNVVWPDTHDDAIECAAGLAIYDILCREGDPEAEVSHNGRWVLSIWST